MIFFTKAYETEFDLLDNFVWIYANKAYIQISSFYILYFHSQNLFASYARMNTDLFENFPSDQYLPQELKS